MTTFGVVFADAEFLLKVYHMDTMFTKCEDLVGFLKNCSFKNCGSFHLFSNGLPGVSYSAKWRLCGVRYTEAFKKKLYMRLQSVRYIAESP